MVPLEHKAPGHPKISDHGTVGVPAAAADVDVKRKGKISSIRDLFRLTAKGKGFDSEY